jgi:hypothetical protein
MANRPLRDFDALVPDFDSAAAVAGAGAEDKTADLTTKSGG